jgi:hypothetical protein
MNPIHRRSLLRRGLVAAAAVGLGRRFGFAASPATNPALPEPCLPGAWKKHGIVLEPTEAWEAGHVQNFTCPVEPLDGNRWRLWYSACGKNHNLAFAEGAVGGPMKKSPAVCTPGEAGDSVFAIGHLPDKWKPVQVVHLRLRNGKHRIYFWVHGPEVARYLAAESDDGHRYTVVNPHKPVLYHPHDRAAAGIPSVDGVVLRKKGGDRPADEPVAEARQISNDATMVYQLDDGTFEMYSVALVWVPKEHPGYVAFDNAPGLLRVIDRYRSDDGLFFPDRKRVIQCDAKDPADQQFYHLSVTRTPKGCVGMLGHYRVQAQTMDLEWCFSPDGEKWQRPHRSAWLPRGAKSEPDSYGIYPPAGLVQRDNRWHLFYTATNTAHNEKESYGPPRTVVMLATTDSIWA